MKGKIDVSGEHEHELPADDDFNQSTKNIAIIGSSGDNESTDSSVPQNNSPTFSYTDYKNKSPISNQNHNNNNNNNNTTMKTKNRFTSSDISLNSCGHFDYYKSSSTNSIATTTSSNTKYMSTNTETITNYTNCMKQMKAIAFESNESNGKRNEITKTDSQAIDQTENIHHITINSIDDANNFELDAHLINSNDGFHEVQCYIDEHGSPKVREKRKSKKNHRKYTLRQELKARTLGASCDENLMRKINANKTPNCVSFTRLFKKFRETFCKFCLL